MTAARKAIDAPVVTIAMHRPFASIGRKERAVLVFFTLVRDMLFSWPGSMDLTPDASGYSLVIFAWRSTFPIKSIC
jgi:hypothetical protein